jgi:photosystem I P700 chlorophyll a apoprotein A1
MYRYVNSSVWSKVGHFSVTLAKGPQTTTWIWNIHADAHDYRAHLDQSNLVGRKVFASNLAHVAVVLLWISGMHYHGAYFSNYGAWLKDPKACSPSISIASVVHQDILASSQSSAYYFQGIRILSGFFQLWRSEGIIAANQLKSIALISSLASLICVYGAYLHMHSIAGLPVGPNKLSLSNRFRGVALHHLAIILGLASIAWSGHQYHISSPIAYMLEAGIDPQWIPAPHTLLSKDLLDAIIDPSNKCDKPTLTTCSLSSTWSIAAHHFYVGIVLITGGIISLFYRALRVEPIAYSYVQRFNVVTSTSYHAQLSVNLGLLAVMSAAFAFLQSSIPVYPELLSDYATVVSLYCHHMCIAGLLLVGCGAHAAIYCVADYVSSDILKHRDLLISHLIWVTVVLGLHAFGLYLHNDTLQALGRPEDTFSDSSIQLKPILALMLQATSTKASLTAAPGANLTVEVLDGRLVRGVLELGTADYMVHHIHAFTIHVLLLIILKGILYARTSRLITDKQSLGFRYPCDGPGRGGTCQVSPWDHIYLALFWMYNALAITLFHYFWKMQSDSWSINYVAASNKVTHLSGGDYSVNSITINGWLRNFLWSQSSQVIQSYTTSLASYGLIFLGSHFIWAFSLMYLYSGRGYWQELIESIIWAHNKLKIVMQIQPRALSISHGRAVGVTHYLLGGIGCSWSYIICRVLALS